MDIRNITKEDLPKLAELISCEELATRDDISFEHSAVAVDENGKLVRYIDYDEWERQDSEECLWLAIAEQNSFHALDSIERSVDLKIAQLYAKKGVEIPPEPETDPILKKKYLIKKTQ